MATAGRGDDAKKGKLAVWLREQAHKEVMDLLGVAEKSHHPDLRTAAVDMAKRISKHQRSQSETLSPTLILVVNIILAIAITGACWYAFLHFSQRIAYEVSAVSILLFLVVVGISLFMPGYLSQSNFMKILSWPVAHIKAWRKSQGEKESEN